jgi:hypothetical protein
LTFNRLQGVISQKIVLFITTAVRNSNPTINQPNELSKLIPRCKVILENLIVTRFNNRFNAFTKPEDSASVHKSPSLDHRVRQLNPAQNFNAVSLGTIILLSHPREGISNGQIL